MPPGIGQNDRHRGRAACIQTLIMAAMMAPKLRSQQQEAEEEEDIEDHGNEIAQVLQSL